MENFKPRNYGLLSRWRNIKLLNKSLNFKSEKTKLEIFQINSQINNWLIGGLLISCNFHILRKCLFPSFRIIINGIFE